MQSNGNILSHEKMYETWPYLLFKTWRNELIYAREITKRRLYSIRFLYVILILLTFTLLYNSNIRIAVLYSLMMLLPLAVLFTNSMNPPSISLLSFFALLAQFGPIVAVHSITQSSSAFPWIANVIIFGINALHYSTWIFHLLSAIASHTVISIYCGTQHILSASGHDLSDFWISMIIPTIFFTLISANSEKVVRELWVLLDSFRKSERLLRLLFDTVPLPTVLVEVTNYRIIHFNRASNSILGHVFRPAEWKRRIGPDFRKLFAESSEASVQQAFDAFKIGSNMEKNSPTVAIEVKLEKENVVVRKWFKLMMNPITWRNTKCAVVQMIDVTQQIQEKQESQEALTSLIDTQTLVCAVHLRFIAKSIANHEATIEDQSLSTILLAKSLKMINDLHVLHSELEQNSQPAGASTTPVKFSLLQTCDVLGSLCNGPTRELLLSFDSSFPDCIDTDTEAFSKGITLLLGIVIPRTISEYESNLGLGFHVSISGSYAPGPSPRLILCIEFNQDQLLEGAYEMLQTALKETCDSDALEGPMWRALRRWLITRLGCKASLTASGRTGNQLKLVLEVPVRPTSPEYLKSYQVTDMESSYFRRTKKPGMEFEWKAENRQQVIHAQRKPTGSMTDLAALLPGTNDGPVAMKIKKMMLNDQAASISASNTLTFHEEVDSQGGTRKDMRTPMLGVDSRELTSTQSKIVADGSATLGKSTFIHPDEKFQTILNMKKQLQTMDPRRRRLISHDDQDLTEKPQALSRNSPKTYSQQQIDDEPLFSSGKNQEKKDRRSAFARRENPGYHSALLQKEGGWRKPGKTVTHMIEIDEERNEREMEDLESRQSLLGRRGIGLKPLTPANFKKAAEGTSAIEMGDDKNRGRSAGRGKSSSAAAAGRPRAASQCIDRREMLRKNLVHFERLLREAFFEIFMENLKVSMDIQPKLRVHRSPHRESPGAGEGEEEEESEDQEISISPKSDIPEHEEESDYDELANDSERDQPPQAPPVFKPQTLSTTKVKMDPATLPELEIPEVQPEATSGTELPASTEAVNIDLEEEKEILPSVKQIENPDDIRKPGGDTSPPADPFLSALTEALNKAAASDQFGPKHKKRFSGGGRAMEHDMKELVNSPRLKSTILSASEREKTRKTKSSFATIEHTPNAAAAQHSGQLLARLLPKKGVSDVKPMRIVNEEAQSPARVEYQQFIFRRKTPDEIDSASAQWKASESILMEKLGVKHQEIPPHLLIRSDTSQRRWVAARREPVVRVFRYATPPRILIVDDSEMYLNSIQHIQLPFPVQIMTAPDGLDGVKVYEKEMAKGNLFHFILLDLHMVHMGGLECARNIRRVETENLYPHTFIIGHSADDESEVRDKCIDVGMDDFRSKPFGQATFSEIMAKLGEIIQEQEIRQEIDSTF